jgi:hypothetical protein
MEEQTVASVADLLASSGANHIILQTSDMEDAVRPSLGRSDNGQELGFPI